MAFNKRRLDLHHALATEISLSFYHHIQASSMPEKQHTIPLKQLSARVYLERGSGSVDACFLIETAEETESKSLRVPSPSSTAQSHAYPLRPPKRHRETDGPEESPSKHLNASLDPPSDFPVLFHDSLEGRVKRRKREDYEHPVHSQITTRLKPTHKKVRFHPSTFDNSIWGDLFEGKYKSESFTSEDDSDADSEEASCEDRPSPPPQLETLSKLSKSRREISRYRAEAYLKGRTWNNQFQLPYWTTEPGTDPDGTLSSQIEEQDDWPEDALDDVSVPRSSPPPSERIKTLDIPVADASRYEAAMDAKRRRDAKVELPSIYLRPFRSILGHHDGEPFCKPVVGTSRSDQARSLLPSDEVSRQTKVLLDTLNKFPVEDARAVKEALERIGEYHSRASFEAGYQAGIRVQQALDSQEDDAKSEQS